LLSCIIIPDWIFIEQNLTTPPCRFISPLNMATHWPSARTTNLVEVINFVTNHNDTYPAIHPSKANLSGKSMLITGASKGVGKTTAIRYAMAGCSKIALAARSPLTEVEKEVKAAAAAAGHPEPQVLSLNVDITSAESVNTAAATVSQAFGGSLDILIANAGYLETWTPVVDSDPVEWWHTWETNMKGTYLCAKYFLPQVLASELKTVIVVSSHGSNVMYHGASAYQGSKFALCRFTEFLDQEYHDKGLIAISVHPGGIPTELALGLPKEAHHLLVDTLEVAADGLLWLGKERREWMAGRYFSCNWDVEEFEGRKEEIVSKDLLKFRLRV
jgi:NAD(P)-dependent dehydrogenase (short-subunit alcohol dehydrogenase family)